MTDVGFNEQTFDDVLMASLDVPALPDSVEEKLFSRAKRAGLVKDGQSRSSGAGSNRWKLVALVAAIAAAAAFAASVGGGLWNGSGGDGSLGGALEDSASEGFDEGDQKGPKKVTGGLAGTGQGAARGGPGAGGQVGLGEGTDQAAGVDGEDPGDATGAEGSEKEDSKTCTAEVTVRVKGEPADGIRVELISGAGGGMHPANVMMATTAGGGIARFDGVARGIWKAHAILEGHSQAKALQHLCKGDGKLLKEAVNLDRAAVLVHGLVSDREGNPLANSSVHAHKQVTMSDYWMGIYASVDARGQYRIWLPDDAQNYRVRASAVGHEPNGNRVPSHESNVEMNIQLARLSTVYGTVTGPNGPVPKADLMITNSPKKNTMITRSSMADDQGRFALVVGPSRSKISAHKGDLSGSVSVPAPAEGSDIHGVIVEVTGGRSITGSLRVPTGEPVANKNVSIFEDKGSFSAQSKTDSNGSFSFAGLPLGRPLKAFALNSSLKTEEMMSLVTEVAPDQDHVELLWEPAP